jgi:hypothetical protein
MPEAMEDYIILILEKDWDMSTVSESEWTEMMRAHDAFTKAVEDAGAKVLGGDALQPPSKAVHIVPARDGAAAVFTDGPFADTKEIVTGFYKIGVSSAAQARELAALCPSAGSIHLYPVMDTSGA